ncbi:glycoside hydrolase family 2 protein [Gelatoporia subvermispora B]|uniref:Beta-mannosidase A n=1 Tax=Ceriporiopsis subvermispora (strain B) TaxID=914234 RepID=M2QNK4_CERS8|nr:glycoside hydrolase family 2 protein [Gelatoporia subvermispora B]
MSLLYLGLFLVVYTPSLVLASVFSLSDLAWTLKNQNGSIVVPASIPSHVHLDLLKAGIITEPVLGINDFTQRWIVNDNWTYTADLTPFLETLPSDSHDAKLLVFYGLDTIANITLAGQPVAWVNNQFQQYVFDITNVVGSETTDANITVAFESAWLYGQNVSSLPDVEFSPTIDFEYPGVRNVIRKTQSDFGWDWGPAFVPSGIFKPAYIITLSESSASNRTSNQPASHPLLVSETGPIFIEELSLEISKAGQMPLATPEQDADWVIKVGLAVRSVVAADTPTITIAIPELGMESVPLNIDPIPASTASSTFVTVNFSIPDSVPQRWYPHDLGTPQLYNFTITLSLSDDPPSQSASFTARSGFRTIELAQTPYSQDDIETRGIIPGDQWHFVINGNTFYSKGSSIVPFDPFYPRVTTDQVRWVLQSAINSGQNMVRVWGGGIYQPSDKLTGGYEFYPLCDELGILAWSEMIFSDALYPINDFLVDSVETEVRQNVRRVNKHPSNAQWAGSNEIEGIIETLDEVFPLNFPFDAAHYEGEFLTLFQDTLYNVAFQEQTSVPYTDSSTTNGILSLNPYVLRLNNKTAGDIYGNTERYNYIATAAFDYTTYPVARFVNEFGFHSMPSFYTWEEVLTSPDDFSIDSSVVLSHLHHYPAGGLEWPNLNALPGLLEMEAAVALWLPLPGTSDSNQTFAQWCWSTQVFQTMTMISEIAWYRHGAGQGENNLGALVWQANDIWPGASWSAMERSGRWKVLQYGEANIFSPVVIYPFWTASNETLDVLVISDRWEPVSGTAQLTWYDWSGTVLNASTHSFTVPALNNSLILSEQGLDNILPAGQDASEVWMLLNLTANVNSQTVAHEQYFTPTSLALANLSDPSIEVSAGSDLTFTLSAKGAVAPWTWIDHPANVVGAFVDPSSGAPLNGFYLIPGLDRTVQFVINSALSSNLTPDPSAFVVRSLWNNTHA